MLVRILKEPKNAILKQYQKLLALDEVSLEFEDDAIRAIAEKAYEKDTGARALRAIIEEFMLDIMYEIPEKGNIKEFVVTADVVRQKIKDTPESAELIQFHAKKDTNENGNQLQIKPNEEIA